MSRVVVLGASRNRAKFGNKAVRAYRQTGHEVIPINPLAQEIEGCPCYPSIDVVPGAVDIVSVYLPPERLLEGLPAIARKGCRELWVNPGAESEAVIEKAERLGLNVIQACSLVGLGLRPSSF
tara:strand:+ start:332 stop:700 length:369 start_codon:yes stop_codon:yes gene_type:complete